MHENCPSEMQSQHIQDIAQLKTEVSNLKSQVEDISPIQQTLAKLTVLTETVVRDIEKRDKQRALDNDKRDEFAKETNKIIQDLGVSLVKINENLDGLNTEMKQTRIDLIKLEEQMDDKFENIETKVEEKIENIKGQIEANEEIYKIDVRVVIRDFFKQHWSKIALGLVALYEAYTRLNP